MTMNERDRDADDRRSTSPTALRIGRMLGAGMWICSPTGGASTVSVALAGHRLTRCRPSAATHVIANMKSMIAQTM